MPYEEEPRVKANMKVIGGDELLAVGSVTIDGFFTINNVHVRNIKKPDGEQTLAVLMPKKKCSDGHWESVFSISKELYKEIDAAVTLDLASSLGRILDPDKIKVSVSPYVNQDFLGYATVTYDNFFTVKDIRILKADNANGIRLDFPYSYENGKSNPLFSMNDKFSRNQVTQLVSRAYQDALQHPELQQGENKENPVR